MEQHMTHHINTYYSAMLTLSQLLAYQATGIAFDRPTFRIMGSSRLIRLFDINAFHTRDMS